MVEKIFLVENALGRNFLKLVFLSYERELVLERQKRKRENAFQRD